MLVELKKITDRYKVVVIENILDLVIRVEDRSAGRLSVMEENMVN
jgi:hypothetical protein